MKVTRESGFKAVVITLETAEELKTMNALLRKRDETVNGNAYDAVFPCRGTQLFSSEQRNLMGKMYRELPSG